MVVFRNVSISTLYPFAFAIDSYAIYYNPAYFFFTLRPHKKKDEDFLQTVYSKCIESNKKSRDFFFFCKGGGKKKASGCNGTFSFNLYSRFWSYRLYPKSSRPRTAQLRKWCLEYQPGTEVRRQQGASHSKFCVGWNFSNLMRAYLQNKHFFPVCQ